MLNFLSSTRVFLAAGATDLRKSFDTLGGVVREVLAQDPLSGHLFAFTNRRRNGSKSCSGTRRAGGSARSDSRLEHLPGPTQEQPRLN